MAQVGLSGASASHYSGLQEERPQPTHNPNNWPTETHGPNQEQNFHWQQTDYVPHSDGPGFVESSEHPFPGNSKGGYPFSKYDPYGSGWGLRYDATAQGTAPPMHDGGNRYDRAVEEAKWISHQYGHEDADDSAAKYARGAMNLYEYLRNGYESDDGKFQQWTPKWAWDATVDFFANSDDGGTADLGGSDSKANVIRRALTVRWGSDLQQDQNWRDEFNAQWSKDTWAQNGEHGGFDEGYWG